MVSNKTLNITYNIMYNIIYNTLYNIVQYLKILCNKNVKNAYSLLIQMFCVILTNKFV
jgi:hypothetical protein